MSSVTRPAVVCVIVIARPGDSGVSSGRVDLIAGGERHAAFGEQLADRARRRRERPRDTVGDERDVERCAEHDGVAATQPVGRADGHHRGRDPELASQRFTVVAVVRTGRTAPSTSTVTGNARTTRTVVPLSQRRARRAG